MYRFVYVDEKPPVRQKVLLSNKVAKVSSREPVFDVMKGIGIILMLVGHIPPGEKVYGIIYSFHMPLFFLVSGAFAKVNGNAKGAKV